MFWTTVKSRVNGRIRRNSNRLFILYIDRSFIEFGFVRIVFGLVQKQVTSHGWLGSTPGGRRPQVRGFRTGGSLAIASSTPATQLLSPGKLLKLNHAPFSR